MANAWKRKGQDRVNVAQGKVRDNVPMQTDRQKQDRAELSRNTAMVGVKAREYLGPGPEQGQMICSGPDQCRTSAGWSQAGAGQCRASAR